jgi:hypothetical protein
MGLVRMKKHIIIMNDEVLNRNSKIRGRKQRHQKEEGIHGRNNGKGNNHENG